MATSRNKIIKTSTSAQAVNGLKMRVERQQRGAVLYTHIQQLKAA